MAYQPLKGQHVVAIESVNGQHTTSQAPTDHNPFQAGFQDIQFDRDASAGTETRASKHAPHWSSSTNTTVVTSENSSLKSLRKVKLSRSGTWMPEIVTLLVGFGAVASIIGVIARFNGRALPEWPYQITLNALIALLATVANATMSITLSSGISQSKWIHFKKANKPLSDVEVFDEASRGSWGALNLLVKRRGGYVLTSKMLIHNPDSTQISWLLRSIRRDRIPRSRTFRPADHHL